MKAYKITRENLRSLVVSNSSGGVQYKIGHTTVPNIECGPLTAFKRLKDAEQFKKFFTWLEPPIFKCEVDRDNEATGIWRYPPFQELEGTFHIPLELLPEGTILCKRITLRRLVKCTIHIS